MANQRKPPQFFTPPGSPFQVSCDGTFLVKDVPTGPGKNAPNTAKCREQLEQLTARLDERQRVLYAQTQYAVLCIFQAMDAAGKDSTIRAVMRGLNPAGFQVFSFQAPSVEEYAHDFLWRATLRLPERGRIGIFNRSYYEEVLIARVHPEFLTRQHLPWPKDHNRLWEDRFESIQDYEKHLVRNGTIVLKFWLNVSKKEQRRRFLDRLKKQKKNWKFSEADTAERAYWDTYMRAYEDCLNKTSTPWAPWYAIPADNKPYMRLAVAQVLAQALEQLDLHYPTLTSKQQAGLAASRKRLEKEG